ncbi:MAG: inositol phosphorylceramide synthase [Gemmatimonadetes bacterium]|nr:inositol phosphorylceramide synthase [Gemmatimonadota bacterium]
MKNWIYRALYRLRPDLTGIILFTLLWLVLIVAYGGKLHLVEGSILLPSYIAVGFLLIALFYHLKERTFGAKLYPLESFPQKAKRILRDWVPVIYLVMVYETLRDYTGLIRPDYIDTKLYELDVILFGVEPVIWIQRFVHPILTDYFTLMYGLYLVPPMAMVTLLYRARRREDFEEAVLATVLCFYIGFFGYITFPAGPPRFYDGLVFDPPQLEGFFGLYELMHDQMDRSSYVMHRASFPSLHVAVSALGMLLAFRFGDVWNRKWLAIIGSWLAVNTWISTVYLRHHWAVDIFAGWIVAVVAYYAARWVRRIWNGIDAHCEAIAVEEPSEARMVAGAR